MMRRESLSHRTCDGVTRRLGGQTSGMPTLSCEASRVRTSSSPARVMKRRVLPPTRSSPAGCTNASTPAPSWFMSARCPAAETSHEASPKSPALGVLPCDQYPGRNGDVGLGLRLHRCLDRGRAAVGREGLHPLLRSLLDGAALAWDASVLPWWSRPRSLAAPSTRHGRGLAVPRSPLRGYNARVKLPEAKEDKKCL